jgi:hypothetical protein
MSAYDKAKKAIQDVLVPDLQEIKGELKGVKARLEAVDQRFDDLVEPRPQASRSD